VRDRDLFTRDERLFEAHQHDVVAARLERDGLAGGKRQSILELDHLHHIVFDLHLVDLGHSRQGGGDGHQAIIAAGGQGDETGGHIAAVQCGTAGRVGDLNGRDGLVCEGLAATR